MRTPPADSAPHRDDREHRQTDRWLVRSLAVLAVTLAANSLLGPLALDVIDYPLGQSLVYQTVGLEAVSLVVVAPWCLLAAALVHWGRPTGPILALPPAGYVTYMFAQYVVGPAYATYNFQVLFHLGVFVLGGAILVCAWTLVDVGSLPASSRRRDRLVAVALVGLAGFTTSRYIGLVTGAAGGATIPADATQDPAMFWSIVLLDLGVVVPATVATAVWRLRGAAWARVATYGVVGWFTLVPFSVLAMALVMLANDDPNASVANVAVLGVAAALFVLLAAWVYRPLVGSGAG